MRNLESPTRILRRRELIERAGLSPSTLDRMERAGHFPARRRLGQRAVGWLESEVNAWLAARKVAR